MIQINVFHVNINLKNQFQVFIFEKKQFFSNLPRLPGVAKTLSNIYHTIILKILSMYSKVMKIVGP